MATDTDTDTATLLVSTIKKAKGLRYANNNYNNDNKQQYPCYRTATPQSTSVTLLSLSLSVVVDQSLKEAQSKATL